MPRNADAFQHHGEFEFKAPAGAYRFVRYQDDGDNDKGLTTALNADGIIHGCPCGCGAWSGIWFEGRGRGRQEWKVSGEWPKATLAPSIGIRGPNGEQYHWHGYLQNGVFEER